MNFLLERGVTLTRRPKRLTLHHMSKAQATAFGLNTAQLADLAKQSVAKPWPRTSRRAFQRPFFSMAECRRSMRLTHG